MTAPVRLIWAQSENGVIGRDGVMPWYVPEDLAHFKQLTLGDPVVMGRNTWEALPPRFRPLPGRRNIVVTRSPQWRDDGAEAFGSISEAIEHARLTASDAVWIIGGAQVYRQTLDLADRLEVTEIDARFEGDAHAPDIDDTWVAIAVDPASGWHQSRSGLLYRFVSYERASL